MNFQFTIYDEEITHPYRAGEIQAKRDLAAVTMHAAYLGPWCSRCGKKGNECRDHAKCQLRQVTGKKTSALVSLPRPTDEWMADRGYGRFTDSYYSGGRYKRDNRTRFQKWPQSESKRRLMVQRYAYELSMGRVEVAA